MTKPRTLFFIVTSALLPYVVSATPAEVNYKLAAPIPGSGTEEVSTIEQYFRYLFPFLLSIAAVSALVMFIYGAVRYMASAGNSSRAGEAKSIMTDAIIGLLIAVGSVLILRTINPALIELDLNIPTVRSGP